MKHRLAKLRLVTGRLLARDMTKMICLDLTGTKK